ncbi:3-methyl-2-oxobutanoate hydroxymethyltransferase [Aeoliella mucimassa]|nr:3-methyl-2-oxobutanoate hydroxymethyltransferase [Aeoliella mucimassa]
MPRPKRITVPQFTDYKQSGKKISMLTAYDYPTARLLDEAGVDGILVGDTLGMVVQGHETTLPVTMDEMIYHAEMVGRAVDHALVVVDMPFPSNHLGQHKAVEYAGRILKESRAQAVKLEGGAEQADTIRALVSAGIPVMAHCGLAPQSVHKLGGYRVQRDHDKLLADAHSVTEAGAFAMVLECIPSELANEITQAIAIPTIGIGAGPSCDGQVLVIADLLGITSGYVPKFAKQYANIKDTIISAVETYCNEVRTGEFPGESHEYK